MEKMSGCENKGSKRSLKNQPKERCAMSSKNAKFWVVAISVAAFAMMFSLASLAQGNSSCQPDRGGSGSGLAKLTPGPGTPGIVDPSFGVCVTPDAPEGMNHGYPAGDQAAGGVAGAPDIFSRIRLAVMNYMQRLFAKPHRDSR